MCCTFPFTVLRHLCHRLNFFFYICLLHHHHHHLHHRLISYPNFLLTLQIIPATFALTTFHPLLQPGLLVNNITDSLTSNTGLRVRFYPSAIQYLNSIASDILAEQLPRLIIPNIYHRLANDQGYISLKRVRVSRFRRAKIHNISVSEPNKVTWTMYGLNMWILGDLSGQVDIVVPLNLEGMAEIQADGIDFKLESALERSPTGAGQISTLSCRTNIKQVLVENHNGGLAGIALNLFKMAISEHIRPLIQTLICKKVTRFIDEDMNEKLAQLQTKLPLTTAIDDNLFTRQFGFVKPENMIPKFPLNITNILKRTFASNFFINYRLNEDPKCYNNTAELASIGRVEVENFNDETPFGPSPLYWNSIDANDDEMMSLLFSDYIPNSLFYHAFRLGLLNVNIDEFTAPTIGPFLKTSCSFESICLADLLPGLAQFYPNNKIQLTFTATRAPVMLFSSNNGGRISMNVNGIILLFVYTDGTEKKQAAVLDLDAVITNQLQIKNNYLVGRLSLEKFDIRNRVSNALLTNEELSSMALLSSEMLENMINDVLRNGFPIPLPEVISLIDAKLEFFERNAMLSSRFTLDQRRVRAIASNTIFNTQPFITPIRQKTRFRFRKN